MISKSLRATGSMCCQLSAKQATSHVKIFSSISPRSYSHKSSGNGSCKCMCCAAAVTTFNVPSTRPSVSGASYHASSQSGSPLLLNNQSNVITSRRDSNDLFIQKREFAFSSEDAEDGQHIENLLANNKEWVKNLKEQKPLEYSKLGANQTPKYLYIGCSDSRVPANQIIGMGPGDVFVHRNVGNLVHGNDLNALAVLEFALGHLGVTDIIVTGHYGCGAVKAASTRQDLGMLENWLRSIRDIYRMHRDYLSDIKDDEERHKKLVELNVIEQCINVYKTGVLQRQRQINLKKITTEVTEAMKMTVAPRIHGLVFDTATGYLKSLPIDYSKIGKLDSIYGLY